MTEQGAALIRVFYFGLFIGAFLFFLQWESGAARFPFPNNRNRRRHVLRNLAMLVLVVLVADMAIGEGLLHAYTYLYHPPVILLDAMRLPLALQIVLGFLASDLLEYGLHVASHRIGWFWRLHSVHHTDTHLDVTTAGRSHPLDVAVYVVTKIALYALLGLPLWIEGVRAIVHNTLLCVQHANVNYPRAVERLRWLLVTPGVHRVHHDRGRPLIDRNFGFIFPFWDRLFGTYVAPGSGRPPEMGLAGHEDEQWQSLWGMLTTPLRNIRFPRGKANAGN